MRARLSALVGLLTLGGCSLTLPVSGTSDHANEVFTGTVTGTLGGQGSLQVASNQGGVCNGTFRYSDTRNKGAGAVDCDDGRQGDFVFRSDGKRGYGFARMSDGGWAQFLFGSLGDYSAVEWSVVRKEFAELSVKMALDITDYCDRYPRTPKCTNTAMPANPAVNPVTAAVKRPKPAADGDDGDTAAPASARVATSARSPAAAPAAKSDDLAGLRFPSGDIRPDDVAVIIGNADYPRFGHDIPALPPARADAALMRRYATQALGIRDGNIIALNNATGAQMVEIFGNDRDPKGKLYDWVKPGLSRVFIYYAGHGAPAGKDHSPMLVPADAGAAQIALSGYPLSTLYANLAKLPAERVTVMLEACFSGASPNGTVIPAASPIAIVAKPVAPPQKLTVIAAAASDQIASWDEGRTHGLMTRYFALGMSGKADEAPYGDGDGAVTLDELDGYLKDTVAYAARRAYGRDQTVQIVKRTGP